MSKIIVGDVETTGVTANSEIIEVAWVEIEEDDANGIQIISEHESFINPGVPVPPNISGITGITNKDIEGAPSMIEFLAVEDDGDWVGTDITLVAHNSPFDSRFLSAYFNIVGQICTLRLSRRYFPESPDHKLQTLKYLLEIPDRQSHRAMDDVLVTVELLKALLSHSGMSLSELKDEASRPALIERMSFGKHKGKFIKDILFNYRRWLLASCDLDPDLRHTLENLHV